MGKGKNKADIKVLEFDHGTLIKFSFKYLDLDHPDFDIRECEPDALFRTVERLKGLSSWTMGQLHADTSKSLRRHGHDWEKTDQKDGFAHLPAHLHDYPPMQFQLSKNGGRIHGFTIAETFYIVWIDRNHKVYK